jgi:hypothetical protein
MAVNGGLLIADASGLPTTEGTRGSGAATTRDTLEPGFNFLPSATPCSRTVPYLFGMAHKSGLSSIRRMPPAMRRC